MPIYFHVPRDEDGFLSIFSRHGFAIDGVYWPTVEHYFQAQKAASTKSTYAGRASSRRLASEPPSSRIDLSVWTCQSIRLCLQPPRELRAAGWPPQRRCGDVTSPWCIVVTGVTSFVGCFGYACFERLAAKLPDSCSPRRADV